jgi:DNA repair exonuclease SbcCD ATPase subunit
MERQKEKPKEVPKEVKEKADKELEELREELARLKELRRQKAKEKQESIQEAGTEEIGEEETIEKLPSEEIEARLDKIEDFLTSKLGEIDQKAYKQNTAQIEKELQEIELEIIREKGVVAREISTYELLLNDYPWLEEKRYVFMYSLPNKKIDLKDYESWKGEWSKVFFDYARYAILHILYLRKLESEKPFSKFDNRNSALKEIAEELVNQEQAEWLSKSKEKLRVYWKSLDNWAEEIYDWAMEISPLEPILIFEIREANKDFNTLPHNDIIKIFKILEKDKRGKIIKLDDGQLSFKIKIE